MNLIEVSWLIITKSCFDYFPMHKSLTTSNDFIFYEKKFYSDIDECSTGSHNCRLGSECTNLPGGYICTCYGELAGGPINCSGDIKFVNLFNFWASFYLVQHFLQNNIFY